MTARAFQLRATLRENVIELRRYLGAVHRELSLRALANLINQQHPRGVDFKAVERWVRESDPVEPDIASTAIMAGLAGVSFEHFALGKRYGVQDVATGTETIVEADLPMTVPPNAKAAPVSSAIYIPKPEQGNTTATEEALAAAAGKRPARKRKKA